MNENNENHESNVGGASDWQLSWGGENEQFQPGQQGRSNYQNPHYTHNFQEPQYPQGTSVWGQSPAGASVAAPKSRSWIWGVVGALIMLVVIAFAALFYIAKSDKEFNEVNGAAVSPAESMTTVTEAVSESTSTVTETAAKSTPAAKTGGCMPSDFPDGRGDLVVVECTGQWAYIGPAHTDALSVMHWENGQWVRVEEDGEITTGMAGSCFTSGYIQRLGMPSSIANRVECDPGSAGSSPQSSTQTSGQSSGQTAGDSSASITSVSTSGGTVSASHPACDGRTILIVQSVIGGNDSSTRNELSRALERDGDLEFTSPGQCSSLRGSYNGSDVYPVYFDLGSDQAAACAAKREWGGNVRTLNNKGDFSDPC